MPNFSIQKLGPRDVDLARELFALFQSVFSEGDESLKNALPSNSHLARLIAKDDFHVIVALHNSDVIGGLTAYELELLSGERELFIYDVAVTPVHQRQGIGRALIESARQLSQERHLSALYVAALVEDDHAVRFYGATGLVREDVAWFVEEA